jgi:heme-degrading monooxygenase HmoA
MSDLIILRAAGDTDVFRRFLANADNVARLEEASARARSKGAIHHRFGIGDGEVFVVDEWESAAAFQEFFSDPALQEMVTEMGVRGEPQITVAEAVSTAGDF